MTDISAEKILEALGLQKHESSGVVAPVVGAFVVGGLIGVGIGLLFAPKAGEELRRDIGKRVDEAFESKEDVVADYKKPGNNERPSTSRPPQTGAPTARPSSF